jgi:small subunit ribosomal protein S6
VGTVALLDELDRTLRITDGVMRFRLIKLRPGVPDAPDMRSSSAPARRVETETPAEAQPEPAVEVEVDLAVGEPA